MMAVNDAKDMKIISQHFKYIEDFSGIADSTRLDKSPPRHTTQQARNQISKDRLFRRYI